MAEIDWSQVMPNLLAGKTTAYIRQNRLAISKYLKDKFNLVLEPGLASTGLLQDPSGWH